MLPLPPLEHRVQRLDQRPLEGEYRAFCVRWTGSGVAREAREVEREEELGRVALGCGTTGACQLLTRLYGTRADSPSREESVNEAELPLLSVVAAGGPFGRWGGARSATDDGSGEFEAHARARRRSYLSPRQTEAAARPLRAWQRLARGRSTGRRAATRTRRRSGTGRAGACAA